MKIVIMKYLFTVCIALVPFSLLAQNALEPKQDSIYTEAEVMPEYVGGVEAMYKFIARNIVYPAAAKRAGVEGTVYTGFIVEKDGTLSDIKVVQYVSPEVDAESVRVISAMPKWNPGMQDGKPVRVRFSLPIRYKLDTGKKRR